jgi:hypothetical protein
MSVSPEMIEEFFQRYGWTYSREGDNTWITGVRTRVSAFRIMIRLTDHWVFFIINPLVVSPSFPEERLRFYYHALRYNLDMNFAKLGVDSDGDLFMAIEIPTENFDYTHFVDALDGISHHATMVYAELFGLAHNPHGTIGRYDFELETLDDDEQAFDEHMAAQLAALASTEDDDSRVDEDDLPPANASDDIMIGGRRLKITNDDEGKVQIEFEDDDDPPRRKRGRPKKSKPDEE